MKWFYNLKLGMKLILSFVFMACIAGLMGYVGITSLQQADESDTILYEKNTVPLAQMSVASTAFQRQRANIIEIIYADTKERMDDQVKRMKSRDQEIEENINEFAKTLLSEEGRRIYNQTVDLLAEYAVQKDQVVKSAGEGNRERALLVYRNELEKVRNQIQANIQTLNDLKVKLAKERSDNNTLEANSAIRTMLIVVILGMFVAVC